MPCWSTPALAAEAPGSVLRIQEHPPGLEFADDAPDQAAMDVEGAEFRVVLNSEDVKEVTAFIEKRGPVFMRDEPVTRPTIQW
jgi:hypothetical protein